MSGSAPQTEPPAKRHEPDIARVRGIWITVVVFLAALVMIAAGVWHLLGRYRAYSPNVPQPIVVPDTTAPVTHWDNPPADLAALRQKQRARLDNYGWIDQGAGIVRIPIERAMELMAQRGWPATTQPATQPDERQPSETQPAPRGPEHP